MSKVWLITGTSRGLGRDLANAVLAAGDRLVATEWKELSSSTDFPGLPNFAETPVAKMLLEHRR